MVTALTAAYQSELKRTRHAVAARVAANWRHLPDLRDERIPGFLAATLPVVKAGQGRAVALTSAYLSKKLGVAPVGLDIEALTADIRGGVDPVEVYTRPFITARAAIFSIGIAAAIDKGESRLMSTADMDIAMTGRDANLAFAGQSSDRVIGWIRVADAACCDFCTSIDGARTGPDQPQPLHNRCGCTADPITVSTPSYGGALLALGAIFGEGVDAVEIHEHGELGPVIGAAGDEFAGPDDLDNPDYVES